MVAGTVTAGVERDLEALPGALGSWGLAMTALELARQMDGDGSAAAKAACGRALAKVLGELREMSPGVQSDAFDALAQRRAARVAKGGR